jgi:hypothetical protein
MSIRAACHGGGEATRNTLRVIRGLDPRIHQPSKKHFTKKMDGRIKSGHDAANNDTVTKPG